MLPENSERIRILIVDDQPIVRQGLRMRLGVEPDLAIVGEAEDGLMAVEIAQHTRPDLVLMDVEMPRMDGIAATRALRDQLPQLVVILMSIYESPHLRDRALKAGAVAFVEKQGGLELLLDAIHRAFKPMEKSDD
jgi:DNA-binding NarL/FixJ family response regulator